MVFDDADIPSAVNGVAFAAYVASGQTCVSGTRLILEESIYNEFMAAFVDKVKRSKQASASAGSFYAPTVIEDIDVEDELWKQEVFGPILVVTKFQNEGQPYVSPTTASMALVPAYGHGTLAVLIVWLL